MGFFQSELPSHRRKTSADDRSHVGPAFASYRSPVYRREHRSNNSIRLAWLQFQRWFRRVLLERDPSSQARVIVIAVVAGVVFGYYFQVLVFFLHVRVGFTGSVLPTSEMSLSSKFTQSLIEDTRRVMYVCKKTNWDYVGLMLHYNKCGAQVVSCKWFNNREVYSPNVVIRMVKRTDHGFILEDTKLSSEAERAGREEEHEEDPLRIINNGVVNVDGGVPP
ncbi:hypothetical protein P43SY_003620 [Pythium insidiosum]|uniref:Uncharacterized protein n=1 Tax=Pythium insidiosum TaxID=114742 RepID=A0AAD5LLT2_PYTIN|nr:hypothetical protein P43SY_003620 [Pythium insidiosum]